MHTQILRHAALTAVFTACLAFGAAGQEKPDYMQRADADMQKVLMELEELGAKPISTLTPEQARKQPTPADAVMSVLKEMGKTPPKPQVTSKDISIPGAASEISARIYTPEGQGPFPVVVYYHGGGWVIANIDTYEASAQALASKANAIVVSSHYRQAPAHKFPAAHEDAFAAYKWVLENAKSFNGNPQQVAVAGESAGGNLAINMSIKARETNTQMPVHQLLIYPVAGTDMTTKSYMENANAQPLSKAGMEWFVEKVVSDKSQLDDPRLDIVDEADLSGLPPTTIITAEIDPLRSEGQLLATQLEKAGVPVANRDFEGATHEFFGMAPVVQDAVEAQEFAANQLQEAFDKPSKRAQAQ